jgi:hypothetical protein
MDLAAICTQQVNTNFKPKIFITKFLSDWLSLSTTWRQVEAAEAVTSRT